MNLHPVLGQAAIRHVSTDPLRAAPHSVASGFRALDALLPGGGWPMGGLTEILIAHEGIGALHLVAPALARLSQGGRWLAWVAPPYVPYAPALAGAGVELSRVMLVHPRGRRGPVQTTEQALRSGTCSAVLTWLNASDQTVLARLQTAAEAGRSWGLVFRPYHAATQPSPALVRMQVEPVAGGVDVHFLKRSGGWAGGPVHLSLDHSPDLPHFTAPCTAGLNTGRYQ